MMEQYHKSYWNAAVMAGVILGLIVFVVSVAGSYLMIQSEPSGSLIGGTVLTSAIGCLIGAFAGVLGVRFYINEHGAELSIGKGAVIGLFSGLFLAFFYQLFMMIWPIIDSSYIQNLQDAMIANIEMIEALPAAQKDEMIDAIYHQMQNYYSAGNIFSGLLISLLTYGLINVLSGLLAAKFMGKTPLEIPEDNTPL